MRARFLFAALLLVAACAQVKPSEEFAYQTEAERLDALASTDVDVADSPDVPVNDADAADAVDASDVLDAEDADAAVDVLDVADAADTADVTDVQDALDAADAVDVADAEDAVDAVDTADAEDVADVPDVADAPDEADQLDAADIADTPDGGTDATGEDATTDAQDTDDAKDADDAKDVPDEVDSPDVSDPCATLNCDDGNPCTDDTCLPFTGCNHSPGSGKACAPDPCHSDGTCDVGVCKFAAEISCDDGNDCSVDSCNPAIGCTHVSLNNGKCVGDLCFTTQTCKAGVCQGGSPTTCDDGDVCTDDSCDGKSGCVHAPNTASCDDGDTCTGNDVCAGGQCAGVSKFVDATYGGGGDDVAHGILALADGFLLFGETTPKGNNTVLTRTDIAGKVLWEKPMDSGSSGGRAAALLPNGFAVVSSATSDGTGRLIRTTTEGDIVWVQSQNWFSTALAADANGIAVVGSGTGFSGSTVASAVLSHVDLSGGATWTVGYSDALGQALYGVSIIGDGYIAAGGRQSKPFGPSDFLLVRTDSAGALLWQQTYGGAGNDRAQSVIALSDGYLLAGVTSSKGAGADDAWLVRTNLAGTKLWDRTYGGKLDDTAVQLLTVPGGFAFCGSTASTGAGGDDLWLVRTDALGNKVFGFPYGGANGDGGAGLAVLPDGFALTGYTQSKGAGGYDAWLLRTDLFGNTTCATSGVCFAKSFADCTDGNPCTADLCDASHAGCFHGAPAAFTCDDGLKCTGPDVCAANVCSGPAIDCNDNNVCTADSCDPEFGCVNETLNGATCGGDKCTSTGVCSAGGCASGAPIACADTNPCTSDGCDLTTGCTHAPTTGAPCDDAQICTVNDQCTAGNCSGTPDTCDDGNACTNDTCNPVSGCKQTNNTVSCASDGCFVGQVCSGGSCGGGTPKDCSDGNSCTSDFCDFGNCAHGFLPNAATCTTGTDCVVGETCADGVCGGGGPMDCNDNNPCTIDSCSDGKCLNPPAPVGTECTNHGFCDASQACVAQMAAIPAGSFWMGCNSALDSGCNADESPQHNVTLSAYAMDLTETTVAQYKACVDAGVCTVPSSGEPSPGATYPSQSEHPVNFVNWTQAQTFCNWRGPHFDLPTEAQWEMAARGSCELNASSAGDPACAQAMRTYPWGEATATCSFAVMWDGSNGGCGTNATAVVNSKSSGDSPNGLHDMAGNVLEWNRDWYDAAYYGSPAIADPLNSVTASFRVVRGGSFIYGVDGMRAGFRGSGGYTESGSAEHIGFRCARAP